MPFFGKLNLGVICILRGPRAQRVERTHACVAGSMLCVSGQASCQQRPQQAAGGDIWTSLALVLSVCLGACIQHLDLLANHVRKSTSSSSLLKGKRVLTQAEKIGLFYSDRQLINLRASVLCLSGQPLQVMYGWAT